MEGTALGTPLYAAPEQLLADADRPVSARSDLYSLGVMIYELLSGSAPFSSLPSALEICVAKVHRDPPHLGGLCPALKSEPQLVELVMSLLDRDPDRRPASARAVREAIQGMW